jgi:hypothetical protein
MKKKNCTFHKFSNSAEQFSFIKREKESSCRKNKMRDDSFHSSINVYHLQSSVSFVALPVVGFTLTRTINRKLSKDIPLKLPEISVEIKVKFLPVSHFAKVFPLVFS